MTRNRHDERRIQSRCFPYILLTNNHVIYLLQLGVNEHKHFFHRQETAFVLIACAI